MTKIWNWQYLCLILLSLIGLSNSTTHAAEPWLLPLPSVQNLEYAGLSSVAINAFAVQDEQTGELAEDPALTPEDLQRRKKEYHRKKYLWFGSAVVSGIAGAYFRYSADKHYEEYQTATHNASELHQLIDLEDTLYPIAYGIGVACLLPAISYHVQEIQVTNRLQAATNENADLGFSLGLEIRW